MSAKHTIGKWEAEHRESEPPSVADDPGHWTIDCKLLGGKWGPIADTLNRHHCIDPDEDRANATLMAASPELYDACNGLLGLLDLVLTRDDVPHNVKAILRTNHRVVDAKAAIAKATAS